MPTKTATRMALDVGATRIGVALTLPDVSIVKPHGFILNDQTVMQQIRDLVEEHQVETLVVGLPRGMEGQDTAQTAVVRDFVDALKAEVMVPIILQDEAVTSVQAEEILKQSGKPYQKGDIDAQAAMRILQDYIEENE